MPAGLEIRNNDNAIVIDGSSKGVFASVKEELAFSNTDFDTWSCAWGSGFNYYGIPPGGGWNDVFPANLGRDLRQIWVSPVGEAIFIALSMSTTASLTYGGKLSYATADVGLAKSSGYLDIFNEAEELIWSAEEASRVPVFYDSMVIPAGSVHNTVVQKYVGAGARPYILLNSIPGWYTYDEHFVQRTGLAFRFSNGYLQMSVVSDGSSGAGAWNSSVSNRDIYIPLAILRQ
jgi:hypothetical protein